MKYLRFSTVIVVLASVLSTGGGRRAFAVSDATSAAFPLKVSENGRYLIDRDGRPFLYHADTAWNLGKKLTLDEAAAYLDDRKNRGFTAIQIQAVSKEQGPMANREGHNPFNPPDDILKPNEAYWKHFDNVLDAARARGLFVGIAPLWIRWGGQDREGWRNQLTDDNAGAYGRFLGERYKRFDNLMWILGGDADPKEKADAVRKIGSALKQAAPHHLLTVHNAPEHASAEFFSADKWLDVNLAYSYREVQPHVLAEYARQPARPIILGESGYEEEDNDKRGGDAWRMRRQAYGTLLSGAFGHAFGQKHVWRFDADWRAGLDSPATRHMGHIKALFAGRRWERLVPDAKHELLTEGYGKPGDVNFVSAARTEDGSLAIVYLPERRAIVLDPSNLAAGTVAFWFDPTNGSMAPSGPPARQTPWRLEPPAKNAAGDSDFVLVLEAPAGALPKP